MITNILPFFIKHSVYVTYAIFSLLMVSLSFLLWQICALATTVFFCK